MAGIVGYGAYAPKNRIKAEEIAAVWGADAESYKKGLMLQEKSVPSPDQDVITMSVEAARRAVTRAGIDPQQIGACYVGSESHPYAVKPSGTVVAEAIGADTSQGAPGDALEYSASAGAAAFIFGTENLLARVDATYSFMTDTPDFWRREYMHYPRHAGRFPGEPELFKHTLGASKGILAQTGLKPEDFAHAVFHQPNGKFPMRAGLKLGFTKEQLKQGLLSPILGNTYSGASPIGLTAVLDVAKPGDRVFMCSFGSGAGSDAFVFTVEERITEVQDLAPKTWDFLTEGRRYLTYGEYAKYRRKIRKAE